MTAARKSAVAPKTPWLQPETNLSPRQRRSANRRASNRTAPIPSSSTSSPRKKQRGDIPRPSITAIHPGAPVRPISNLHQQPANVNNSQSSGNLPMMPTPGAEPVWLLRLYAMNRYSSIAAFLFVSATLVVYGFSVYSQALWSQAYQRLQNLHRNERQLITTNATLKSKMAEEAEKPTAGLVFPTPERTIFLPEASQKTTNPAATNTTNVPVQLQTPSPLGY
ncbi:hypothetical protein B6N60_03372 [Richelia sinica FACHB-800]|uniref:Cell division protein FtsL n=1 Tax=Richelia sinica FACHB-800 TaxID=1357546 RepID=A0A975TA13_9NOST|nr:hypothetical protein [Richelia sinica]MBD2663479.1 hypothetical protein [Richelia sinica FACHB-800]QXE24665.1 hypothetical protein B6N60_03372 [Richelia sinica FACHB-800]